MSHITLWKEGDYAPCWECHKPFAKNDQVFIHEDAEQMHRFHLACITKEIADTFFPPKCPRCHKTIDTEGLFTWKDRTLVVLKWVKHGAVIGSIAVLTVGMILHPPSGVDGAAFVGLKGAIFGGFTGGALKVQSLALNKALSWIR